MSNKSRVISNINATANSQAVHTVGKYASKGINKTAKWMAADHTSSNLHTSIMEMQQSMNYGFATLNLLTRRSARLSQNLNPLRSILCWIADYSRYAWDMLLGFLAPFISMLFWGLFRVVVIVLCNAIFFYALFWFLFT